jgi:integrase/recombinase XerC
MNKATKLDHASLPLADWPAADKAGWSTASRATDPLNPNIGYANRWKPSTRKLIETGYGHFLAWLARSGRLDSSTTASHRVNRDVVTGYWKAQQNADLAPHTIAGRMQQLGNALQAIEPDHDWQWVTRGAFRLQSAAMPVHDITKRMQPAHDVLALGHDMMSAAENDRFRTAADRATLYRDGLIICMLVLSLVRLANLTSITIGQHLRWRGERWWLSFGPAAVKGGKRVEVLFPKQLTTPLARYIDVHRKVLLSCTRKSLPPTDALWISQHGTHMTSSAVALQIKARTKEAFGAAINPHAFRHIGATTIATANSTQSTDIMNVLGHKSIATSEKYYNKAKVVDATQRLQETVDAKRRQISLGL